MIEIENLSLYLPQPDESQKLILDDINLTIRDGEFICVAGPSGCGKTTLLRILATLTKPTSGTIRIDGVPLDKPNLGLSMVFQEFALLPWRSVVRNVEFPLESRGLSKEDRHKRALEALAQVHLTEAADLMPRHLSGGMKQRVGLARALATDARYLLMDEPFGAVDPQVRRVLQATLLELWSGTNKTIIFVTHDLDEAAVLSDRIVCLSRSPGHIREIVTVEVPRPRFTDTLEIAYGEETARCRGQLWKSMSQDIRRTAI